MREFEFSGEGRIIDWDGGGHLRGDMQFAESEQIVKTEAGSGAGLSLR